MNGFRWSLRLTAVSMLLAIGISEAKITDVEVKNDDRNIVLIARPFGFTRNGVIEVHMKNDKVFLPQGSPPFQAEQKAKLGFFITTAEAETQLESDLSEGSCVLENSNIDRLFTFQELEQERNAEGSKWNFDYMNKIAPDKGGEYSLFFANCLPQAVVSFEIQVALYNEGAGGAKDYLSAGEAMLPTVYMVMFVLYAVSLGIWLWTMYSRRSTTLKIHYLMAALLLAKALTVLSQSGMYHLIRTTGGPDGWNIAYYVFTLLRGIMLFTVIVLIGTGWSFLKPFLADKEKKVILVLVPLQVFANIATVILDESGPAAKGWFTWRDIFHLLDIICCCAILFPIVWSIKHLREASHTDGKSARNVVKLTLFRQFYVMVVSYIYFTRIVVYLLKSTTPYQYVWLSDAAGELATLAFYCITGYLFRPAADNPYFALEPEELEELESK
mmetsp:Transcript_26161/g.49709  ORF Transcript_26161/g.49709 Transcript_26161/m.49709 type:complete len:442 (-) Transcript_26161:342-1667(-)|eukprot:CAMPEP_0114247312 /NCGR_PEP_ID=MMETSP0058-20121206/12955_1 /TAXON_ID=36894 /ORGANISM="Pyramimonas parkeae, CCMP726" /LENGTH=441 /DNA_ID=CAMNT_0001360609 /DNA_START=101 /DNA_END=1426 /DNA_ORIENTATION=-